MASKNKTMEQLGGIMLKTHTAEYLARAYAIDPTDVAEVGRQALAWCDINKDGTLN